MALQRLLQCGLAHLVENEVPPITPLCGARDIATAFQPNIFTHGQNRVVEKPLSKNGCGMCVSRASRVKHTGHRHHPPSHPSFVSTHPNHPPASPSHCCCDVHNLWLFAPKDISHVMNGTTFCVCSILAFPALKAALTSILKIALEA